MVHDVRSKSVEERETNFEVAGPTESQDRSQTTSSNIRQTPCPLKLNIAHTESNARKSCPDCSHTRTECVCEAKRPSTRMHLEVAGVGMHIYTCMCSMLDLLGEPRSLAARMRVPWHGGLRPQVRMHAYVRVHAYF